MFDLKSFAGLGFLVLVSAPLAALDAKPGKPAPDPRTPLNTEDIDYPVPWGLRQGHSARVFLIYDVDEAGIPRNVRVEKSMPVGFYDKVAETTVEKLRYPPGAYRTGVRHRIDYCLLTDRVSPIVCRVTFTRLAADGRPVKSNELSSSEEDRFLIDGFAGPPRANRYALPVYPYKVRGLRPSDCGWVQVHFDLKKSGRPSNLRITDTGGDHVFNNVVRDAMSAFRFEPGSGVKSLDYRVTLELPGRCRVSD